MALVLWQHQESIRQVLDRRHDLRLIGAAFVLTQTSLLLSFLRWSLLVRAFEPRFPHRWAVLLGFIGYLFNLVTPGAVGGDVVKAAYLARIKIRTTDAFASMVMDRILGLLGILVLAAAAGVPTWGAASRDVRVVILILWVALAVAFLSFVVPVSPHLLGLHERLTKKIPGRILPVLANFATALLNYRRCGALLAVSLALSVLGHALNVIVCYLVGVMLFSSGMSTTLGQHFLIAPLTFFIMAIPLPLGALGLTEEVGGKLFDMVGHPDGALVMMGMHVLMLASGLEGACLFLARWNEIRAMTSLDPEVIRTAASSSVLPACRN